MKLDEFLDLAVDLISIQDCMTQDSELYCIRFNKKIYKTKKGKSVWAKRHHAIRAFKLHNEHKIKSLVTTILIEEGTINSKYEARDHPDYKNAWDNFINFVEKEGLFEIVKLQ